MGSYKCPLRDKIRPSYHDDYHTDGFSYVCPVLRDAIEQAAKQENYKRLLRLLKMGIEAGQIKSIESGKGE